MIALMAMNANAKKWRVNNTPGIVADFTTPDVAVSSLLVLAGDTIYIEGSQIGYSDRDLWIYKPLVIQGTGFFLNENPKTQNFKLPAIIRTIGVYPGASGTIISGLIINGYIQISESNITIKNNYVAGRNVNDYIIGDIHVDDNLNNIIISKNINPNCRFSIGENVTNIVITNNYFHNWDANWRPLLTSGSYNSGIINNNIFVGGTIQTNFIVYSNNIFISCNISDTTTNVFMNNLCDGVFLPVLSLGNIRNVNMAEVFVGATGNSTDGQWQLKTGSPAIGAATDGGDCGMFGGVDPYQLSGISGPSIYSIIMPNAGTPANGINVTVKAKAH